MQNCQPIARVLFYSLVFAYGAAAPGCSSPADVTGRWDATVNVVPTRGTGFEVPFRFEIVHEPGDDRQITGSFFDGDQRVTSNAGRFENGRLSLTFDQYATVLKATLHEGRLDGAYERGGRGAPYAFQAIRHIEPVSTATGPAIDGEWRIAINSSKGESAWRFIVRQSGAEVSAAILRIDGDTGTLTGRYQGDRFVLSHFSGARPALLEVTPASDGTLDIVQNRATKLVAIRLTDPRVRDVPAPTDPTRYTKANTPQAPLTYGFADLGGRLVSNTDPQFHDKVVIISITGSWCPNCHDEAPFLSDLYKKYREAGLEVVAFAFEEAEQLKNPTRLKAFIKRYDLQYTVLLVGEPEQLQEKVPQADNLTAFPTMLFLGRDGRIRSTHAGFASQATGAFHEKDKNEITATVERLLAEKAGSTR